MKSVIWETHAKFTGLWWFNQRIVQFLFAVRMLLIDLLIDSPISSIGQGLWTFWPELHYRGTAISALLSVTMQITFAADRFGNGRAHYEPMVVNRWIVRRNIMKESHVDVTVCLSIRSDRNIGWLVVSGAAGKGSMKPRTVDSTIPLIPRSSTALSSTWNLINAARRWRWRRCRRRSRTNLQVRQQDRADFKFPLLFDLHSVASAWKKVDSGERLNTSTVPVWQSSSFLFRLLSSFSLAPRFHLTNWSLPHSCEILSAF